MELNEWAQSIVLKDAKLHIAKPPACCRTLHVSEILLALSTLPLSNCNNVIFFVPFISPLFSLRAPELKGQVSSDRLPPIFP